MKAGFLSQPGVISSLGCDLPATIQRLLQARSHALSPDDTWVVGRPMQVGAVSGPLLPWPEPLAADFRSRNNQLLLTAAQQIETALQAALTRYGAARIGVVIGTTTTGVQENYAAFEHQHRHGDWARAGYHHPHQMLSAPADCLAAAYGLSGPVYSISTACTSGARALISAQRLLAAGVCDAVVCGGVDSLSKLTINGFAALEALSAGVANPFSANRDGINIGEAAALFVLSRDPEGGLPLRGCGSSSDAWHMSSPRPDGLGACTAIQAALTQANLAASAIGWVNLHGTGTQHNDQMESVAIAASLGGEVACTATKPLTGHTLGAAGALEAALVWGLASRTLNPDGLLPPQLWDGVADPQLPPLRFTVSGSRWPSEGPRIGLSTSFAFGGNNTALIIGEATC